MSAENCAWGCLRVKISSLFEELSDVQPSSKNNSLPTTKSHCHARPVRPAHLKIQKIFYENDFYYYSMIFRFSGETVRFFSDNSDCLFSIRSSRRLSRCNFSSILSWLWYRSQPSGICFEIMKFRIKIELLLVLNTFQTPYFWRGHSSIKYKIRRKRWKFDLQQPFFNTN